MAVYEKSWSTEISQYCSYVGAVNLAIKIDIASWIIGSNRPQKTSKIGAVHKSTIVKIPQTTKARGINLPTH